MITTGRILAVQERRFRLLTREGQVYLLTLARNAAIDEAALAEMQHAQTNLEVSFSGEPNLVGGVAHSLQPVPAE